MARNQWEEALQSILTGGLQGYQAGQASTQEINKTLMLEKLKQTMRRDAMGNVKIPSGMKMKGGKFNEYGIFEPTYEFPSTEDIQKESDISTFNKLIPRYRKYAIRELGIQPPEIAKQRIGQLEGSVIAKAPTQKTNIEATFKGLAPVKTTGGGVKLNPNNLAMGMAQMFKNTESAMPDTSENAPWQRIKGVGTRLGAFTGFGVSPKQTAEIATLKVRARSYLKNFENNRFTDKDIEQAIQGMTDVGKTTAERLATVVNVVTAAASANGITEDRIKPVLAKELGMSIQEMDNIINQVPGALGKLKGKSNIPKIGFIKDGYKFKGGNPANKNSWEKQ